MGERVRGLRRAVPGARASADRTRTQRQCARAAPGRVALAGFMIRYARHGAAFESRTDLASVGELDWLLELGVRPGAPEGGHRPDLGLLGGLFETSTRTGEGACGGGCVGARCWPVPWPVPWPVLGLCLACASACVHALATTQSSNETSATAGHSKRTERQAYVLDTWRAAPHRCAARSYGGAPSFDFVVRAVSSPARPNTGQTQAKHRPNTGKPHRH